MENVMSANNLSPTDHQLFMDYMHFKTEDDLEQFSGEQYNYGDPENSEDDL